LTKLKDYDRAIEVFEKGININPSDPRLYLNLGKALTNKGRNINDRDILTTAIQSYKMVMFMVKEDSMLFIIAKNAISAIEVKDFGAPFKTEQK
jgi:tetratricopeptide (TPR) repeat protein